ncbi:MAG: large-conductance mechanosensitive channel protein MscL [Sinomicrobium sp.]|nr:large-conductance mechanosensitive channel protein MscL [Sinomicrobium sp.]
MGFFKDFKSFLLKGDIVNLAVAVVIGAAFGKIVTSFTKDVLMPPIGLLMGDVNFAELSIVLKEEVKNAAGEVTQAAITISYGSFLQTVIDFIIIGLFVFVVLRSYEKSKKKKEEAPEAPKGPTHEELLAEIRDLLKEK